MGAKSNAELNLETLHLLSGGHNDRHDGVCLMEAVAWFAGEHHSARPQCSCPVLTRFGMSLNDGASDEDRQLLKPLIPKLVGTRADRSVERKRAYFLADRAVRLFAPIALRARGKVQLASELETLPPIVDESTARSAVKICRAAAYAADAAADAAAYAADAAYAAAADAPPASGGGVGSSSALAAGQRRRDVFLKAVQVFEQAIAITAGETA